MDSRAIEKKLTPREKTRHLRETDDGEFVVGLENYR